MSAQKYALARYPWTSISPSALSALTIGDVNVTQFRPTLWWDLPTDMYEQAIPNDMALLAFLEAPQMGQFPMNQPVVKYRCSRPADLWTTNKYAIVAADTYIELNDPVLAGVGRMIRFTQYEVGYRVLDVDDDHSEGWVNAAGDACNAKVERLTGPAVAIAIEQVARPGAPVMGELGTPKLGFTSTPGDAYFNTISLVGLYGSISRLQMESAMINGWGTHPTIKQDTLFQHLFLKQNEVIFGQRHYGTDSQGAEGQLWLSDGLLAQLTDNVLDAGNDGVNLTWTNLNDFWELLFDSENSDTAKHHFCDAAQFRDIRREATAAGCLKESAGVESRVKNAATLGAPRMVVQLQSGMEVNVNLLRRALRSPDTRNFGFTIDAKNTAIGGYPGISMLPVDNLEAPAQAVTVQSDGIIDTWCPVVRDKSTGGIIKGGVPGVIG